MLTRIGDSLGSWTPRNAGGDPLSIIRGVWTSLVGMDVGRAAQPVAITGDTLIVMTTSAAWSHQLAFLEPQIVRGIDAAAKHAGIVRLRFRVGTIRVNPVARAAKPIMRASGAAPSPRSNPRTAQEALARYRATVQRARAAHGRRGGSFCAVCAAPIERGDRCFPCLDWARRELKARCQRLLYDAPWLAPLEVLEALPGLNANDYDAIRRDLLRTWWDEMALARKRAALRRPIAPDRARLRKIASSYVLLETKMDPNRLDMDSPIRRNALGDLYEFICSVESPA